MSEHWIIRRARAMDFSAVCPLQGTLDNLFIGGMQEMGEHPASYSMEAVSELVHAYRTASDIALARTSPKTPLAEPAQRT